MSYGMIKTLSGRTLYLIFFYYRCIVPDECVGVQNVIPFDWQQFDLWSF